MGSPQAKVTRESEVSPAVLPVVLDANVFVSAYIHPDGTLGQIIQSFLRDSSFEFLLTGSLKDLAATLQYGDVGWSKPVE
jgi:hypothetical protein